MSVSTQSQNDATTLTIAGELDLVSSETVTRAIREAVNTSGTRRVTVDLTRLRFVDSCGIAVLIKGRREADKAGLAYHVTGATGMVREVLSLTGVLEHLTGEPHQPGGQHEPDSGEPDRSSRPPT